MAASTFPYALPPGGDTNQVLRKCSPADSDCGWVTPAGGSEAWPVGAVFVSVVATDPASLIGYGTWQAIGAGRALIGVSAGDPDFGTAGTTGGAKTVAAAGTVSQPTFIGSALGTHSHGTGTLAASAHSGTAVADHASHTHSVTSNVAVADHAAHTHAIATGSGSFKGTNAGGFSTVGGAAPGSSGATGNPSATLSHAVTNNAVTSGAPSATLTHSVTQPSDHTLSGSTAAVSAGTPSGTVSTPTFTGTPTSVLPPFLVVYLWERVA